MGKRHDFIGAASDYIEDSDGDTSGTGRAEGACAERCCSSSQVAPPASQVSVKSQAATPDALRRETDKLHEQLASMLLGTEAPKTIPASPAPVAHKPLVQELSSKVVEIAKPQSHAQKFDTPAKSASESSLDQDEVKIPSWLEPLARNAASHPQNELIAKEDAAHNDRVIEFEVQDLSVPTTATKDEAAEADPVFETHFDGQSDLAAADAPKKSNKGILIGAIAAGLVLAAAGGTWYSRRSSAEPAQVAAATVAGNGACRGSASSAYSECECDSASCALDRQGDAQSIEHQFGTGARAADAGRTATKLAPVDAFDAAREGRRQECFGGTSAYKKLAEPASCDGEEAEPRRSSPRGAQGDSRDGRRRRRSGSALVELERSYAGW